jgi:hypothetical protein
MTQEEFFAYTQLHPDQVNIWYGTGGPPYTLKAITVPVLDSNTPPQDRSRLLENVQQITLPLSTGDNVTVNITSVTQAQSPGTSVMPVTRYYFYNIEPLTLPNIGNIGIAAGALVFSPSLDAFDFADSPYNILEGSIELSRQSSYIMEADRYKIGTLANPTYTGPLNIEELISGSATKADVQDSNYTTTGWINARYEGSKTDRIDYLSEPAISGKFFEASEFPSGSTSSEINYLITSNQVVYKEYFFAGIGDTPGLEKEDSKYIPNAGYGENATIIAVTTNTVGFTPAIFRVGDLISPALTPTAEIMRVEAVGILSTSPLVYSLVVTRGYFGNPQPISLGSSFYRVNLVQIYNVTGNRLTGVPRGQVLVKETGRILKLDSLGFVISST